MSEYIITIKQLATVIAKCHGIPMADKDGNPIFNSIEIDRNEVVELPEIVRCRDCKNFVIVDEIHGDYDDYPIYGCRLLKFSNARIDDDVHEPQDPNGFCAWGKRADKQPVEVWQPASVEDVTCNE